MEIFINKRFNGPPNSGNGGYVAGLIAKEIGKCCEVKLVAPPPLEKKLLLKKMKNNFFMWPFLFCIRIENFEGACTGQTFSKFQTAEKR